MCVASNARYSAEAVAGGKSATTRADERASRSAIGVSGGVARDNLAAIVANQPAGIVVISISTINRPGRIAGDNCPAVSADQSAGIVAISISTINRPGRIAGDNCSVGSIDADQSANITVPL